MIDEALFDRPSRRRKQKRPRPASTSNLEDEQVRHWASWRKPSAKVKLSHRQEDHDQEKKFGQSPRASFDTRRRFPVTESSFSEELTTLERENREEILQQVKPHVWEDQDTDGHDDTIPLSYNFDSIEKIVKDSDEGQEDDYYSSTSPSTTAFDDLMAWNDKVRKSGPKNILLKKENDFLQENLKGGIEEKIKKIKHNDDSHLPLDFGKHVTTPKSKFKQSYIPRIPSTLRPAKPYVPPLPSTTESSDAPWTTTATTTTPSPEPVSEFRPVRVMHTTAVPTYMPEEAMDGEQEEEQKRERVMPKTPPTKSTTPSPISPERKAAIHMLRDRYKSQLMSSHRSSTTTTTTTTKIPSVQQSHQARSPSPEGPRPKSFGSFESSKTRTKVASDYYSKFRNRLQSAVTETNNGAYETSTKARDELMEPSPSKMANFDPFEDFGDYYEEEGEETEPVSTTHSPDILKHNAIRHWKTRPVDRIRNSTTERIVADKKYEIKSTPWSPTLSPNLTDATEETPTPAPPRKTEMLKNFLKSGAHGNDPKKIAAMLKKLNVVPSAGAGLVGNRKEGQSAGDEDRDAAKSIFEKYNSKKKSSGVNDGGEHFTTKKFDPTKKSEHKKMMTTSELSNLDETSDEASDDYEDPFAGVQTNYGSRPWSPMGSGFKGSSSSSYFRKFAKSNIGGSFRRPRPKDTEDSKVAKEIFSKYSKPSDSTVQGEEQSNPKYGSGGGFSRPRRPGSYTRPTEGVTAPASTGSPRRFAPKVTTTRRNPVKMTASGKESKNDDGFWPTPRPFRPERSWKKMTKAPTVPTTEPTTTRATRRSTTIISSALPTGTEASPTSVTYPPAKLDTSNFLVEGFETPFVDLERIPSNNHNNDKMSVDATSFVYEDEDIDRMDTSDYSSTYMDGTPMPTAKLPIRNVLDIFEELRLSFGKRY